MLQLSCRVVPTCSNLLTLCLLLVWSLRLPGMQIHDVLTKSKNRGNSRTKWLYQHILIWFCLWSQRPLRFASAVGCEGARKLVFRIPFLSLFNEVIVARFHGRVDPLLKILNVSWNSLEFGRTAPNFLGVGNKLLWCNEVLDDDFVRSPLSCLECILGPAILRSCHGSDGSVVAISSTPTRC